MTETPSVTTYVEPVTSLHQHF